MEIVQYFLENCSACHQMSPELKKLKKAGFKVKVVDCNKNMSKCRGIRAVPTLVLKKDGKSKKIVGFASAAEIKQAFEKL